MIPKLHALVAIVATVSLVVAILIWQQLHRTPPPEPPPQSDAVFTERFYFEP